ncbi:odorant receptor 23a-like [Bradysia coprophila]|uniref:odorant receptor 23a-like n=1 Tax=Bradysia coprophila TaxID=38358 RepID=UPI00187DD85F|nr:odorant receptor 23a-like [Bradysia coprophila]
MRSYKIQSGINDMTTLFYRIGFWHRGPAASPRELCLKLFYCILYVQFPISLMGGAIISDTIGEAIFLMEPSVITSVMFTKLCVLIWKQNEIMEFLNGICVFPIRYDEDFMYVDVKLKRFMTFVRVVLGVALVAVGFEGILVPIITTERYLFYKIAFPWDWKTDDRAYWAAVAFEFMGIVFTVLAFVFSIVIWYLLLNCSLRYEVLGNEMGKMGSKWDKVRAKVSVMERENIFSRDLKASIESHLRIRKLVDQLESFLFNLFFLQFCTSGLCICTSIYSLAFNVGSSRTERLCHVFNLSYNISEIFMITLFGNEILVASDRLSYCLFESNFVGQTISVKKRIIIFTEYLKQPQRLMIGNLYPLTLETFTMVLKGAYSMFNILKNGVK